jgi:hypothetical protein
MTLGIQVGMILGIWAGMTHGMPDGIQDGGALGHYGDSIQDGITITILSVVACLQVEQDGPMPLQEQIIISIHVRREVIAML